MHDPNCLFCKIVLGQETSIKVLETDEFIIIKNKYPAAPVHLLVVDKQHREKSDTISGAYFELSYWDKMIQAANEAILMLNLNKTGYKLVNNGAGYNHFEHEHLHILGGSKDEPGGTT